MPLVGLIVSGTVDRIFHSVAFAKANVLVLFARDQQFGHVLFEKGAMVSARLEDFADEEAVTALKQWTSGHYSLIKRGYVAEKTSAHVLLNNLSPKTRWTLNRWLKKNNYQVSLIGYPQQALAIISYIQPDVILTDCPKKSLGLSCSDLLMHLRRDSLLPPMIVVVDDPKAPCTELAPFCVRIGGTVLELEKILEQDWPKTRLSSRNDEIEETAKIPTPKMGSGSSELLPLKVALNLTQDSLTARDYVLALVVLLLGSGMIWMLWWILS